LTKKRDGARAGIDIISRSPRSREARFSGMISAIPAAKAVKYTTSISTSGLCVEESFKAENIVWLRGINGDPLRAVFMQELDS
jgi:hypothetical protein